MPAWHKGVLKKVLKWAHFIHKGEFTSVERMNGGALPPRVNISATYIYEYAWVTFSCGVRTTCTILPSFNNKNKRYRHVEMYK